MPYEIELVVCTTCRQSGAEADGPRDGNRLSLALTSRGIAHSTQKCLAACSRSCAVVLRGHGRWTFVQGGLDPDRDLDALEAMLAAYAAAPAGLVPWHARPDVIRRNIIARIPPSEIQHDP